jgi:hypothetical protein
MNKTCALFLRYVNALLLQWTDTSCKLHEGDFPCQSANERRTQLLHGDILLTCILYLFQINYSHTLMFEKQIFCQYYTVIYWAAIQDAMQKLLDFFWWHKGNDFCQQMVIVYTFVTSLAEVSIVYLASVWFYGPTSETVLSVILFSDFCKDRFERTMNLHQNDPTLISEIIITD